MNFNEAFIKSVKLSEMFSKKGPLTAFAIQQIYIKYAGCMPKHFKYKFQGAALSSIINLYSDLSGILNG